MQSFRDDFFALLRAVNKGFSKLLARPIRNRMLKDVRHVTKDPWHGSNIAAAMEPGQQKVEPSLLTLLHHFTTNVYFYVVRLMIDLRQLEPRQMKTIINGAGQLQLIIFAINHDL